MANTAKQREGSVRGRKPRQKRKVEKTTDSPVEPVPVVEAVVGKARAPKPATQTRKPKAKEPAQEGMVESSEEEAGEARNLAAPEPHQEQVVPSRRVSKKKEAISMGLTQERNVGKLLRNKELMDQVVTGLVENSQTMDTLAGDMASKIQDAMENDTDLRQRLINAAIANEAFRNKLVRKLIDELS